MIKKTYRNFLHVMAQIKRKGYDKDTAESLTHRIFADYETEGERLGRGNANLKGWGYIDRRVNSILDAKQYEREIS